MKSEELWIRDIQAQLNTNVKFKNWAREFGVSKDKKGIFRCGGRLDNAELTEMQKHPIMLDSKHHVTRLIVEQSHKWHKGDLDRATLKILDCTRATICQKGVAWVQTVSTT